MTGPIRNKPLNMGGQRARGLADGAAADDAVNKGQLDAAIAAANPDIADDRILSNISGAEAAPSANTLTAILDAIVGTDRGSLLVRGDTTWAALAPGASGTVLQSQGAGADLFWNGGFSHNTADQSITSTTTLTDITDLSFPVEANKVYRFRATVIIYADAGGFIVSVNGPASPTRVDFGFVGLSGAVTTYGTTATSSAGAINAMPAIQGVIHNGANAGTVALQFRQSSSNAAATTVKSGSWIEWREIT